MQGYFQKQTPLQEQIERTVTNGIGFKDSPFQGKLDDLKDEHAQDMFSVHVNLAALDVRTTENPVEKDFISRELAACFGAMIHACKHSPYRLINTAEEVQRRTALYQIGQDILEEFRSGFPYGTKPIESVFFGTGQYPLIILDTPEKNRIPDFSTIYRKENREIPELIDRNTEFGEFFGEKLNSPGFLTPDGKWIFSSKKSL